MPPRAEGRRSLPTTFLKESYPARIRTWKNRTKTCCDTVSPPGNAGRLYSSVAPDGAQAYPPGREGWVRSAPKGGMAIQPPRSPEAPHPRSVARLARLANSSAMDPQAEAMIRSVRQAVAGGGRRPTDPRDLATLRSRILWHPTRVRFSCWPLDTAI